MPASEVMKLYRQHKLHSGPGGPIVRSKKQATAIQISMARKEGHKIPKPGDSMQQGGLVPETGTYKLHEGEHVVPAVATQTQKADLFKEASEPAPRTPTGPVIGYHQVKRRRERPEGVF
jgi:hypothetical protein